MLSGELAPTSGTVNVLNHSIAYCPQTNALDNLLTVEEIIHFYGKLRRIKNIHEVSFKKYIKLLKRKSAKINNFYFEFEF